MESAFREATQTLLTEWPALQLAAQNDDAGPHHAMQKLRNLRDEIVDYFRESTSSVS